MSSVEIRNTLSAGLTDYLGIPVVLSDQVAPEEKVPYGIYTVTAPYVPAGGLGDHAREAFGEDIKDTRLEQAYATISLTFCSQNRWTDETQTDYIYGDTEAQQYAEKAIGWFLHAAYDELSDQGIVVVDIMNPGNRTMFVIDEAARRYGFDVRIRYTRTDERTDRTIERVSFIKQPKKE